MHESLVRTVLRGMQVTTCLRGDAKSEFMARKRLGVVGSEWGRRDEQYLEDTALRILSGLMWVSV